MPLEEIYTPKYYGQNILKLFVTAQQYGLTASYPSGVLHEYKNGLYTRHMFLTLTEHPANTAIDACRILPEGNYACRKISTHMSDFSSVKSEMKEVLKSEDFSIIETDTLSEQNKKDGYPFELEYYLAGTLVSL